MIYCKYVIADRTETGAVAKEFMESQKRNAGKREKVRRADFLFAGVVFGVALAVYMLIHFVYGKEGAYVQVMVDGEVEATYPLAKDTYVRIDYGQAEGVNILVIEDGKASVSEADCPDKLCVKQRSISKNGESIVCLPHKLVITIIGGEEAEYDDFTG